MAGNQQHVTKRPGGGWQTAAGNAKRPSAVTDTQKEAIDRSRQILQNKGGGEIVIHRPDGRIRDRDTVSPGNDPNPPKDLK